MRFPRDEPNTPGPSRGIDQPVDQPPRWVGGPVVHLDSVSAAIATGKRPAPFRTRKLSPSAPMVLPGRPGGRVGRRRTSLPGWRSSTRTGTTRTPERTTATQHFCHPPPTNTTSHGGRDRWESARGYDRTARHEAAGPGQGPQARPSLDRGSSPWSLERPEISRVTTIPAPPADGTGCRIRRAPSLLPAAHAVPPGVPVAVRSRPTAGQAPAAAAVRGARGRAVRGARDRPARGARDRPARGARDRAVRGARDRTESAAEYGAR